MSVKFQETGDALYLPDIKIKTNNNIVIPYLMVLI